MTPADENTNAVRPPRMALLACSVFEKEIALLTQGSTHIAEIRYFEMGLHDRPDILREELRKNIETLDARDDIEAVALAYGLCGRGTAGLPASRRKLVIPRAHDCMTIFMGSKEGYAEHQRRCPGCFYYTPGWNRERRVPGPERLAAMRTELGAKFEQDDVEFLIEAEREQWAMHDTATYIELGTDDARREADYARKCAEWLGWKFEHIQGDPALLRALLWGEWDAGCFQIIEPGERLGHVPNENIVCAERAQEKAAVT